MDSYWNTIFKNKKVGKSAKTKEEQLHDKIHKRIENQTNVEDHIKSYSIRKAPLYNKYGIR